MKTATRFNLLSLIATILPAALLMLSAQTGHAASATWLPSPPTNDWNTATNWTAGGSPNGPSDTATFASSNATDVLHSGSTYTEVNGIVFNPGASAFTIFASVQDFHINGVGITNNSGITQNFHGYIAFHNSATAGSQTNFTNGSAYTYFTDTSTAGNGIFTNLASAGGNPYGRVLFYASSTAGNGTFPNDGYIQFNNSSTAGNGVFTNNGSIDFQNSSTAGNGTFTNNGGTVSSSYGAQLQFLGFSTAGNGIFTNNGGTASGAYTGGSTVFGTTSSAGNATLIANGGVSGAPGGMIQFVAPSTGNTARVEVFGNGTGDFTNGRLDVSNGGNGRVTIGSIEGTGNVFLGGNNLTVGSNNTSRSFSGVIRDQGGFTEGINGVFTKIGTGTLTFEGGLSNDHIRDRVTLGIAGNSTINLNFTGDPDTIRSLIVGGIGQLPGLYGSAVSGAPNQLPQFAGTGKVLAKMLAVSRKTHGAAGDFDINLPFGGDREIESRNGGANGNYQVVVTFLNAVTFDSAAVFPGSGGAGMVSGTTGNGTTVVTVNLTGVTNAQTILVTLSNVNDGATTENIPIYMGMLIGDTNGDGVVNSGDSSQTKNRAGQPTDATNFRSDVNGDGTVNSGDSFIVKSRSGTSLP